jgi:hypothetical protein
MGYNLATSACCKAFQRVFKHPVVNMRISKRGLHPLVTVPFFNFGRVDLSPHQPCRINGRTGVAELPPDVAVAVNRPTRCG